MSKNYTWNFDPCGPAARNQGPVNPSSEHFKGQSKIQTLVRETLQNSLDAALYKADKSHPVKVTFAFEEIRNPDAVLPNFVSELRRHIVGCHEFYSKEKTYVQMLEYIDRHRDSLQIIRVSDSNTKGMVYEKDNPDCSFYGYLLADGAHVDHGDNDGGGSYGIGKMASFQLSKLNTVLVSTHNQEKGQYVFQGATILCTHKVLNEKRENSKYPAGGFYDCNGGEPATDKDDIPANFVREEFGTDIIIVGVEDDENYKTEACNDIVKNVLINFWPAIHDGVLEVTVGDTLLNAGKLNEKIVSVFSSTKDDDAEYSNPLPYYLAVKGVENGDNDCRKYGDDDDELELPKHPTLGHVQLYIKKNKDSRDRIIATRKPRMVIQAFNKRSSYGYSAVVICDDEEGNKLLRLAEPPAHNRWDARHKEGEDGEKVRRAINELMNYINKCVEHFFASDKGDECDIEGLSELLKSHGEKSSKSGAWTSKIKRYTKTKKKIKPQSIPHNTPEGSEEHEDGDFRGGEGGGNEDNPKVTPDSTPVDPPIPHPVIPPIDPPEPTDTPTINPTTPIQSGGTENIEETIMCDRWLPYSTFEDDVRVCHIKLKMPKAVENGTIYVYVASADGRLKKSGSDKTNMLRLIWAKVNGESAEVSENAIRHISLNEGNNVIDFRFPNDNAYKLSIEIKSHNK